MHLNKKARIALLIVLAVIFAGSVGMYLYQLFQYREGSEIYDEAEALAGLPDLSDLPLPSPPSRTARTPPPRPTPPRPASRRWSMWTPTPTPCGTWTSPPCGR